ncbi:hypothetical protein [Nonomuraea rubra]|uniref:hypothetical protein n=1 Tax=Nonomuraea rubra TaxID=46180 RepID=UPI0033DFF9FB
MLRNLVLPLVLMALTPPTVILVWICSRYLGGSVEPLLTGSGWSLVAARFPTPTWAAAWMIVGFVGAQAALLRLLPGRWWRGPVTPMGERPRYRLNGVAAWALTHAVFLSASYVLGWFSPGVLYDRFGELLVTMSAACLVLSAGAAEVNTV